MNYDFLESGGGGGMIGKNNQEGHLKFKSKCSYGKALHVYYMYLDFSYDFVLKEGGHDFIGRIYRYMGSWVLSITTSIHESKLFYYSMICR